MLSYCYMNNWQQGIPDDQWDVILFERKGHFLQSSHWAAFQQALGTEIYYASGKDWMCLALVERGRLGSRLYAPYGPTAANKKALMEALSALRQLALKLRLHFVRIEPMGVFSTKQLMALGLRRAEQDVQPRLTWVKDLTKPEDELLAEMSATNRNLHRTAAKKGLTFHRSVAVGDVHVLTDMIHDVARQTGITPHSDHYYEVMASTLLPRNAGVLYIAKHEDKPIACAFVFDSPTTRYYTHAGALYEFRRMHPGTPLVSTMIFDAKTSGQTAFDFVGVAPPDQPQHRWAGFSRFKQSFGGDYRSYNGTWELPINTFAYTMYRLILKAYKTVR